MVTSWIARRLRYEKENERLFKQESLRLSDSGRFISREESLAEGLEPSLHPSGGWFTGWGGRQNVPLSYQMELADDRCRKAKRLAGMKNPNHGLFEEFFAGCVTAILYSGAGAFVGGVTGYIASEHHPALMTLGGLVGGL